MDFWLYIIFKKWKSERYLSWQKQMKERENVSKWVCTSPRENTAGALIQMRNNMSYRIICKSTVGMNVMQFPFGATHMNTLRTASHLESQTFSSLRYVYLMSLRDLMLQDMSVFRDRCYNATQTQTNMQNIVSNFENTEKENRIWNNTTQHAGRGAFSRPRVFWDSAIHHGKPTVQFIKSDTKWKSIVHSSNRVTDECLQYSFIDYNGSHLVFMCGYVSV